MLRFLYHCFCTAQAIVLATLAMVITSPVSKADQVVWADWKQGTIVFHNIDTKKENVVELGSVGRHNNGSIAVDTGRQRILLALYSGSIYSISATDYTFKLLFDCASCRIRSVTFDSFNDRIYWLEWGEPPITPSQFPQYFLGPRIACATSDGMIRGEVALIGVRNVPMAMTVDPISHEFIFEDNGAIRKINEDGSKRGFPLHLIMTAYSIHSIVVCQTDRRLFWANAQLGQFCTISHDGNEYSTLPVGCENRPSHIAIDELRGQIYWTEHAKDRMHPSTMPIHDYELIPSCVVYRSKLDGSGRELIAHDIGDGQSFPIAFVPSLENSSAMIRATPDWSPGLPAYAAAAGVFLIAILFIFGVKRQTPPRSWLHSLCHFSWICGLVVVVLTACPIRNGRSLGLYAGIRTLIIQIQNGHIDAKIFSEIPPWPSGFGERLLTEAQMKPLYVRLGFGWPQAAFPLKTGRGVVIPASIMFVPGVFLVGLRMRRNYILRRHPAICASCGYILTQPTSCVCPECGATKTLEHIEPIRPTRT